MISESLKIQTQFAKEILEGLKSKPKKLPSKYFYNEIGDKLFQEIMKMEEYYLTRSEFEIFSSQKEAICKAIQPNEKFQLIELGAGDGLKTKILLEYFLKQNLEFEYIPIDISASVLEELKLDLQQSLPQLKVSPVEDTYFNALSSLKSEVKKVVLFLGSNIGNFQNHEALRFMQEANSHLNEGDFMFIGFDLKKHPKVILDAYNDKRGITKAFNLNLLNRMNTELEADFDLSQFEHYPTYNPINGETRSYLISLKEQTVYLGALDEKVHFSYAEPIFMEVSKKYSLNEFKELASASNFKWDAHFFDCKHYFVNTLLKK